MTDVPPPLDPVLEALVRALASAIVKDLRHEQSASTPSPDEEQEKQNRPAAR